VPIIEKAFEENIFEAYQKQIAELQRKSIEARRREMAASG